MWEYLEQLAKNRLRLLLREKTETEEVGYEGSKTMGLKKPNQIQKTSPSKRDNKAFR